MDEPAARLIMQVINRVLIEAHPNKTNALLSKKTERISDVSKANALGPHQNLILRGITSVFRGRRDSQTTSGRVSAIIPPRDGL